jgi:hypothetical protein
MCIKIRLIFLNAVRSYNITVKYILRNVCTPMFNFRSQCVITLNTEALISTAYSFRRLTHFSLLSNFCKYGILN